jgi:putative ABC transport system substrate-binding protein
VHRRNSSIALAALVAWAACPHVCAQQSERPRRLGLLGFSNPTSGREYLAAFSNELAKAGWIEGKNLQVVYRFADGDAGRLPALAAELVALDPDVLFSTNVAGSLALAHATSRIPVVMTGNSDPVAVGLVKSLARPGRNVTGMATGTGLEIGGKRLEYLKAWVPRLSRVALVYNPEEPSGRVGLVALQDYGKRLGVLIDPLIVRNTSELRVAMAALSRDRPDAVFLFNTSVNYTNRQLICAEALRMHLPTMAEFSQYPESGCLLSYAYSPEEFMQGSVEILNQILHGARPADIPVRQPTRLELVANLRTATAIGLAVSQSLRLTADRVIE